MVRGMAALGKGGASANAVRATAEAALALLHTPVAVSRPVPRAPCGAERHAGLDGLLTAAVGVGGHGQQLDSGTVAVGERAPECIVGSAVNGSPARKLPSARRRRLCR
jgi:hypothetical protein